MPLHEFPAGFKSNRPKGPFEEYEAEQDAPPPMPEGDPAALAEAGNLTDDSVGHLSTGEIVIPVEALKPELLAQLEQSFQEAGLDLNAYVVGGGQEHMNEKTGMPEFAAQPGVGPGAQGRGGRLARISSRMAMMQRQRDMAMQQAGQAGQAQPEAPLTAGNNGMGAMDPFQKLKSRFAQMPQKTAQALPYQIPLQQPAAAQVPAAAPAPAAPPQYVGSVRVLSPEENAQAVLEDAARNPQVYASNPRLQAQLAEAQAVLPQPVAPPAPQAPLQRKIHTTQQAPAPGGSGVIAKALGFSQPKEATAIAPGGGMMSKIAPGGGDAYAAATGKATQTDIARERQNDAAQTSLGKVSSATTPSTTQPEAADSVGATEEDQSKTNRLSDVSSSQF